MCKHLPVTVKKVISQASELERVAFILNAFFYSSNGSRDKLLRWPKNLKIFLHAWHSQPAF